MSSTIEALESRALQDQAASVRRHHTISSSSRAPRAHPISELQPNEDEYVGQDWVGGVGAVGENQGLHRQSSLPSRYTAQRGRSNRHSQSGAHTPSRGMNSLTAITAEHGVEGEGDEEEWERDMRGEMRGWRGDDETAAGAEAMSIPPAAYPRISHQDHSRSHSQSSHSSSISPIPDMGASPPVPPLPATAMGAGVRRHQSLTYGAHGGGTSTGSRSLMRSATSGKNNRPSALSSRIHAADVPPEDNPYFHDTSGDEEGDPSSPVGPMAPGIGRPWQNQSSTSGNNGTWGTSFTQSNVVDDLDRALANLELQTSGQVSGQDRSGQLGGYYQPSLYSTSQNLAQPQQNPNHTKRLTPPPHPPRFRSSRSPSPSPDPSFSTPGSGGVSTPSPSQVYSQNPIGNGARGAQKLSLVTDLSNQGQSSAQRQGPVSAAAYVPPIGGLRSSNPSNLAAEAINSGGGSSAGTVVQGNRDKDKPSTASGLVWDQKERIAGSRAELQGNGGLGSTFNPANFLSNPAFFQTMDPVLQQQLLQHFQNQAQLQLSQSLQQPLSGVGDTQGHASLGNMQDQYMQSSQALAQYTQFIQQSMQQQQYPPSAPHGQYAQAQAHGLPSRLNTNIPQNGSSVNDNSNAAGNWDTAAGNNASGRTDLNNYLGSPIDMPSLVAAKGYNPTNFDTQPQFARYFVIKSYTEDDVHKSLKYEIWSSTDPGNKRLDKAFKECNGKGPIYLFFSVNASGHFCGMAEMLTPVDYTRSSTVWAQDKWKGVFKVRWVFVRDIPNATLRHIRLNNTQERKPVTNSRDTQELLPDAGHEMLRIFVTHPARTSLLQDFAFYELQSIQKTTQTPAGASSQQSPPPQQQQPFLGGGGLVNPMALLAAQQLQLQQMLQQQQQQQQMPSQQVPPVASPPPRQDSGQGYGFGTPNRRF